MKIENTMKSLVAPKCKHTLLHNSQGSSLHFVCLPFKVQKNLNFFLNCSLFISKIIAIVCHLSLIMVPLKKKSRKKDLKKLKKKTRTVNVVPIESRAIESDWWDSFRHKSSSSPGTQHFFSFISFFLFPCYCSFKVKL